jgi:hypothetical protein
VGGAVIGLGFKPTVGGLNPDPLAGVKVHWLQAFQSVLKGVTNNGLVDNAGTKTTPFYDGVTDAAGTNFFVDVPAVTENEYEANPIVSVTFQLFLATDSFECASQLFPVGSDSYGFLSTSGWQRMRLMAMRAAKLGS